MPATLLSERVREGAVQVANVAEALVARMAERDPALRAFVDFDPAIVRRQAAALDLHRKRGTGPGRLHGVPVAVKDIFDMEGQVTGCNSVLERDRVAASDSFVVAALKRAGALIAGKTATAQYAYRTLPDTCNPADRARSPGVSSAGSAAAVAGGLVPLAIGSQTGGSTIMPAAYCGCVGYKPSPGLIPRRGMRPLAPGLDTVGVFARTVPDAALLAEVLCGDDPQDTTTRPAPPPALARAALSDPPVPPTIAFVRPPWWDEADVIVQAALGEIADFLGEQCFAADLPPIFDDANRHHATLMRAEMARSLAGPFERGRDTFGADLRTAVEEGRSIAAMDYLAARDWQMVYRAGLEEVLERCDVLMMPSTPSVAPLRDEDAGSSVFARLPTFTGLPAITLPLLQSQEGLPIGVQLVGRYGADGKLLRTARWLHDAVETGEIR